MDDYGSKMPTYKELFRFVQELSLKCERLEREVARLKTTVSVRQKKVIVECLNQSQNIPSYTFCDWWKNITLQIPVSLNTKEETDNILYINIKFVDPEKISMIEELTIQRPLGA
ncbi:MAG: hypothetical protein ACOYPR_23845 [Saprospiraceae bacterium]